jgi:predicted transcriptional regulator
MTSSSTTSSPLLQEWLTDLQTIDKELEQSAQKILEHCDHLALQSPNNPTVQQSLNGIVENCSFHDLNSQRLRKIVLEIQNVITTLQQSQKDYTEAFGARISQEMSGPQAPGKALSQEDVEALLGHS